jgi:hypothetical protein
MAGMPRHSLSWVPEHSSAWERVHLNFVCGPGFLSGLTT